MRKIFLFTFGLIAALMIIAACDDGGGGGTSTTLIGPEGGVARSADGKLTLTFPAGAVTEDTVITIKRINPGQLPEGVDPADVDRAYELGPDGIEFDEPVTAELDTGIDPSDGEGGLTAPLILLFTIGADGEPELLDDLTTTADGDAGTTTISGELTHFSILVDSFLDDLVGMVNVPASVNVDELFFLIAELENNFPTGTLDLDSEPFYRDESFFPIRPVDERVQLLPPSGGGTTAAQVFEDAIPYVCEDIPQGEYRAEIVVIDVIKLFDKDQSLIAHLRFNQTILCTDTGVPAPSPSPISDLPTPSPSPVTTPPEPTPTPTGDACTDAAGEYAFKQLLLADPADIFPWVGDVCNDIVVTVDLDGNKITISGGAPWVTVTGLAADFNGKCKFNASGVGDVGSFRTIRVNYNGHVNSAIEGEWSSPDIRGGFKLKCAGPKAE